MHFNRTGIRTSFIKRKDLANGELSIWRLERDPAFNLGALVHILEGVGPPENVLGAVLAAAVGQIRSATMPGTLPDGQRMFCVSDDCRTDNNGGWHPEHAAVSLAKIPDFDWDEDRLEAAVQGLAAILKQKTLWPVTA